MELFHFDIESCGQYPDFNTFESSDKRGSELFKTKYLKLHLDDKFTIDEAYLDQSPIISTYGKICCISFGFIDTAGEKKISSFYGDNEEQIVTDFNNLLKKIETKPFSLSGFRINYFDIPWILHKLHKYGIEPANIIYLYGKKPWENRIVDMSDDWKGRFAYMFSFDEMLYELGISSPKEKMHGSMVHSKFWEGKYSEIKEYCERDVASCIEASKLIYK